MPLDFAMAEQDGICPECEGQGDTLEWIDLKWDSCPYCNGHNDGDSNTCDPDCGVCEGGESGSFFYEVPCQDCNGYGTWTEFEKFQAIRAAYFTLRTKYPELTIRDIRTGNFNIRDYWFR